MYEQSWPPSYSIWYSEFLFLSDLTIHYNTCIMYMFLNKHFFFQILVYRIPSRPNELHFPLINNIGFNIGMISKLECIHKIYYMTHLWKYSSTVLKNHKANGSLMVAQWSVAPFAALHPVPVCACLTDTSHTGYHCSLWVDWCSQWVMLAGNSMVLHVCCSTACPQVTFPWLCVCVLLCEHLRKTKMTWLLL